MSELILKHLKEFLGGNLSIFGKHSPLPVKSIHSAIFLFQPESPEKQNYLWATDLI
jgi:hypothetical protein